MKKLTVKLTSFLLALLSIALLLYSCEVNDISPVKTEQDKLMGGKWYLIWVDYNNTGKLKPEHENYNENSQPILEHSEEFLSNPNVIIGDKDVSIETPYELRFKKDRLLLIKEGNIDAGKQLIEIVQLSDNIMVQKIFITEAGKYVFSKFKKVRN